MSNVQYSRGGEFELMNSGIAKRGSRKGAKMPRGHKGGAIFNNQYSIFNEQVGLIHPRGEPVGV
jgi:hypothetical protein